MANAQAIQAYPALPTTVYMVKESDTEQDQCIAVSLGESGYRVMGNIPDHNAHGTAFRCNLMFINNDVLADEDLNAGLQQAYRLGSMFGWEAGEIPDMLEELQSDILALLSA